jgi:hypothetical protein
MGQLPGALGVVSPAKHLVDDVDVAEEIRYHPAVRLTLDLVEQDGAAAVQVLLQTGDLEIGIDLFVGFDEVTLGLEPLQCASQIRDSPGRRADRLLSECTHERLLLSAFPSWRPA